MPLERGNALFPGILLSHYLGLGVEKPANPLAVPMYSTRAVLCLAAARPDPIVRRNSTP